MADLAASRTAAPPPRSLLPLPLPSPFCPPPCLPFPDGNFCLKKKKKSHHHEWITNTAGEIHGWHCRWEGASSPTDQSEIGVCYLHFSQTLCAAQLGNVKPSPTPWYKRVVHTPVSPGRGRRTHQKKGEGKRFMRVYVESRSHEPPNLRAASASIVMGGGGGEKSIGVRETQESVPRSPSRDGRALSARRSVVLGRSLPVLRVCGVSLAQPSLCLPELDSPVTVLA